MTSPTTAATTAARPAAATAAQERADDVGQQARRLLGLLGLDLGRRDRRLLMGRGHLRLQRGQLGSVLVAQLGRLGVGPVVGGGFAARHEGGLVLAGAALSIVVVRATGYHRMASDREGS